MSEEVKKARQAVPRAMFWTIAINGILAYVISLVLLFCLGEFEAALTAPFPIACRHCNGVRTARHLGCSNLGLHCISLSSDLGVGA